MWEKGQTAQEVTGNGLGEMRVSQNGGSAEAMGKSVLLSCRAEIGQPVYFCEWISGSVVF
jgi:hypothetical protein